MSYMRAHTYILIHTSYTYFCTSYTYLHKDTKNLAFMNTYTRRYIASTYIAILIIDTDIHAHTHMYTYTYTYIYAFVRRYINVQHTNAYLTYAYLYVYTYLAK